LVHFYKSFRLFVEMLLSPAVKIENLPSFLLLTGHDVTEYLLGDKIIQPESGIVFWKMEQAHPKIVYVFFKKEKREEFLSQNLKLKELEKNHQVKVSLATYCKNTDIVSQERRSCDTKKPPKNIKDAKPENLSGPRDRLALPFQMVHRPVTRSQSKSSVSKEATINESKNVKPKQKSANPIKSTKLIKEKDVVALESACELKPETSEALISEPVMSSKRNENKMLTDLESFVKENARVSGTPKSVKNPESLVKIVRDSWSNHVDVLEETFKSLLDAPEENCDEAKIVKSLSHQMKVEPKSKGVVLEITAKFLVHISHTTKSEFFSDLKAFIIKNRSKISPDECIYIITRNGLKFEDLAQAVHCCASNLELQAYLSRSLPLDGQVLADFSEVLSLFFESRVRAEPSNFNIEPLKSLRVGESVSQEILDLIHELCSSVRLCQQMTKTGFKSLVKPDEVNVRRENRSLRERNTSLEKSAQQLKDEINQLKNQNAYLSSLGMDARSPPSLLPLGSLLSPVSLPPCSSPGSVSLVRVRPYSLDNSRVRPRLVATDADGRLSLEKCAQALGLSLDNLQAASLKYRKVQGLVKEWLNLPVTDCRASPPPGGWANKEYVLYTSSASPSLKISSLSEPYNDPSNSPPPLPRPKFVNAEVGVSEVVRTPFPPTNFSLPSGMISLSNPPSCVVPSMKSLKNLTPVGKSSKKVEAGTTSPSPHFTKNDAKISATPSPANPVNDFSPSPLVSLGQGWESQPNKAAVSRNRDGVLFPSDSTNRGPRIRIGL